MTLDKIIEILLEAKEHGFDGKDKVLVTKQHPRLRILVGNVSDVFYTKDKIYIEYAEI